MADTKAWLVPLLFGFVATGAAWGVSVIPHPAEPGKPCVATDASTPYDESIDPFGVGPRNVTTARLRVWVVKLDNSRLLASNAGNDTRGHARDGDYQALPNPLIVAFGNATVPVGGVRLPAALAPFDKSIRENLTGHDLGDTVTLRVDRYPWLDIFGPLQVTAVIDALYWRDGALAGGGPPVEPRTFTLAPGSC